MTVMERLRGKTVTIVGLGLMGGSLALALRPSGVRLVGVEVDGETRQQARAAGVVDAVSSSVAKGVAGADLVVLATPVRTILALLAELPPGPYTVLDFGSTKEEICRALAALPKPITTLGGHPMCGKEQAGLAAAEATLFEGATFVLCRGARTTPAAEALALAVVEAIGARPLFLEPATHDALVALVSHLPYLLAATLMELAATEASVDGHVWPVSASGFRDMTRLAGSDPQMMGDIVLTNRRAILACLRAYQGKLAALLELLETGDEGELTTWLVARQEEHARYRRQK